MKALCLLPPSPPQVGAAFAHIQRGCAHERLLGAEVSIWHPIWLQPFIYKRMQLLN